MTRRRKRRLLVPPFSKLDNFSHRVELKTINKRFSGGNLSKIIYFTLVSFVEVCFMFFFLFYFVEINCKEGREHEEEQEDAYGYQLLQYTPGELFLYPIFSFVYFCITFYFTYI
jgi:hypothetical protein